MDDNEGVLNRWLSELDEPTQMEVAAFFLSWRNLQQWSDLWKGRFEPFADVFEIEQRFAGRRYGIFACRKTIYELVVILITKRPKRRLTVVERAQEEALRDFRLETLEKHPEKCREYRFH
jgi:hypothetical protein